MLLASSSCSSQSSQDHHLCSQQCCSSCDVQDVGSLPYSILPLMLYHCLLCAKWSFDQFTHVTSAMKGQMCSYVVFGVIWFVVVHYSCLKDENEWSVFLCLFCFLHWKWKRLQKALNWTCYWYLLHRNSTIFWKKNRKRFYLRHAVRRCSGTVLLCFFGLGAICHYRSPICPTGIPKYVLKQLWYNLSSWTMHGWCARCCILHQRLLSGFISDKHAQTFENYFFSLP